jgi:putative flavoprotein involved in K+ transport
MPCRAADRSLFDEGRPEAASPTRRKTMNDARAPERIQTVVIGGGQAGLSVGYHLARQGLPFVILDAGERVGDPWRRRWDSLRLFTPARYDGLDGMPFPAAPGYFPTKDEMADYLESYAAHFRLPVRAASKVDRLERRGNSYLLSVGGRQIEAKHVVVAMSRYQRPHLPAFASQLDPEIVQLHSAAYRGPAQLRPGGVLLVGAGNSGAEIAREVARAGHPTWLAGDPVGEVPFRTDGLAARLILLRLVLRVMFHRVLTVRTPIGRRARTKMLHGGGPLIRVKSRDLAALGVQRGPRVVGVRDGRPLLADDRLLDVANVVWCTGFEPAFSWIDLPVFEDDGLPKHQRGVVPGEPGLYFVGLHFLYALSSGMVQGVGRDAAHVVRAVHARVRATAGAEAARPAGEQRARAAA